MDIPRHLGQTNNTVTGRSDLPQNAAPVTLEQLRLITGKTYNATVVGPGENMEKITRELSASTKDRPPLALSEWLLKINGKSILIHTTIPLQVGQSLAVKLSSGQILLIQSANSSSLTPTSPLSETRLNGEAITLLLKAINQVMPRQITLEKGLAELSAFVSRSNDNVVGVHAKTILSALTQALPKANQFIPNAPIDRIQNQRAPESLPPFTNLSQPNAKDSQNHPAQHTNTLPVIRVEHLISAIKNSGLFFEQALLQAPKKSNTLINEITQLQKTLIAHKQASGRQAPLTSQGSKARSDATLPYITQTKTSQPATIANDIKTPSTANNLRTSIQGLFGAPTIKAGQEPSSIEPYKQGNPQILNNESAKGASQTAIGKDLKGHLFKAIAALTSPNRTKEGSDKTHTRSYVDAFTQVDLLKTPFNFPHLSQSNVMKANAILADQELSTGQLLKLIAGMLNRIQFNQLNSLYQSQSRSSETLTVQSWFFELPVLAPSQLINIFNLRIDQETEKSDPDGRGSMKKQPLWRIALSFDLEALGAIYVQAILSPPAMSSTIWAERQQTLTLINREMPHFRQRLKQIGLEVSDICCHKGQPKQNKAMLEQSLVDIKA